jgi:hypothetical protein
MAISQIVIAPDATETVVVPDCRATWPLTLLFDLEPVLEGAAKKLGLSTAIGRGRQGADGATASVWVALGADTSGVTPLLSRPGWRKLGPRQVRWTDDYSSILSVLR